MKFLLKKNYIIFFLLTISFITAEVSAKETKIQYTRENISNYFSGIISANHDHNYMAFKYLKKAEAIKNIHSQFNVEFIRSLVFLEKFDKAFAFSKNAWREDEFFFETDLLLGLNSFIKKDYINAEKYFKRLNQISRYNLIFDDFIGNVLIAWVKASKNNKEESFKYLEKIPSPYYHLKTTQEVFLKCFFDSADTEKNFQKLIKNEDYNFSRYNFFLINYLLSKNKITEAKKIVQNAREEYRSNLLIKQTEVFILNKKSEKIIDFFSCKNPEDSLAEFFYVIANLYSSEKDYKLSNFYLKISLFLNENFSTNEALLAENLYYKNKNLESKKIYKSLRSIGSVYSWYASKSLAAILIEEKGKKNSVQSLQKDFELLANKNFEHYFELANFYKDNEYYKESIEYYSLALKKINKENPLFPKILERRGTSYERLGDWKKAEKDLVESLSILPDQAHVLNYLAYSWVDQGVNLDEGLEMLKKANELRKDDGYIIDSLGWVYFAKKNYGEAEFFLQRAVELMPLDPIINDHYGDVLWMQNKNIQARYVWNNVLKMKNTEKKLKKIIKKKLIFGISKKL